MWEFKHRKFEFNLLNEQNINEVNIFFKFIKAEIIHIADTVDYLFHEIEQLKLDLMHDDKEMVEEYKKHVS